MVINGNLNKKEGWIPKDQRRRILMITDDIRLPSGVGNVGREIVIHTSHHYNWVCIGAAIKHPEAGKRFDLSQDTNQNANITDSNVILYPFDGYGNPDFVRYLIKTEKPDAIMLITDPRYFMWLFQIENEIRKHIPILYLNIWDDYPAPMYNQAFYESCDALLGISKQTVNINNIITNFDNYEYYLYYNSGSYAWPKLNTEPPYQLALTNDPIALTWLGSDNINSPYYGGLILSASLFDNNNKDNLLYTIPEYLRDDPANQQYELFVEMVGQFYDNIWVYYKDVTEKYNEVIHKF